MGIDLPLLWAIIIGFGLMMYVIMDGFDLEQETGRAMDRAALENKPRIDLACITRP